MSAPPLEGHVSSLMHLIHSEVKNKPYNNNNNNNLKFREYSGLCNF